MSSPVVVQGTPVMATTATVTGGNDTTWNGKGEMQQVRCRDPLFAVLFYASVIAIFAVAFATAPSALADNETDIEYEGYVVATVIIVLISFLGAGLGMMVLMAIPRTLIQVSLIFTVIMAGLYVVATLASGTFGAAFLGIIMFAFTLCYARMAWSRIPFATANLVTACTAIRANIGVAFYAYLLTAMAGIYSIIWSLSFVGVFHETYGCENPDEQCDKPNYFYLFLLFLCYFFAQQVFQNSIHVTVAGTVGHWWFDPAEAQSCCSQAVTNSFIRTITTSFGSICFGSLLVAILQALKAIANAARNADDGNGIILCIVECILQCLASLLEYFNKWAFIYVGLYGYGYLDAGKNVFQLFRNRGWEAVIADDLVGNALMLVSIVVGLLMGVIAVILEVASDLFEGNGGNEKVIAFVLGFIVGLVITSILLSTIGSGVNAVIVLFADAPAEFQQNHPELSSEMRQKWGEVYPGSI